MPDSPCDEGTWRRRLWAAWRGRVRPVWMRWRWLVVVALAAVAFALGLVGHRRVASARGEGWALTDCAFFTLRLFFLKARVVGGQSWELEAARWLAPAVAAYAAWAGLAVLFRRQFDRVRLRLGRGHVVVCGLGRMGMQLVGDLLAHGDRVVAIERDSGNDSVRRAEEQGAIVLVGRASDPALLRRAGVGRARSVVAICGSDGANVEVAVGVYGIVRAGAAAGARPVRCLVHVVDLRLCALFRRHRIFTEAGDRLEARIVNPYETSARLLLQTHALEQEAAGADERRQVHLVVVGFGQMGESVALQAARIGHFASGRPLRLTVVDQAAEERERAFRRRYPQLGRACDAAFVTGDYDGAEIAGAMAGWASDPGAVTSVAVCFDDDSRSLSCALGLLSELGGRRVPIFVRMGEDAGLAKLVESASSSSAWAEQVHAFGMVDRVCTRRMLLGEELDRLARAIHARYLAERARDAEPQPGPTLPDWASLPQHLKESCRQQADHIPVKLRAVGCTSGPADPGRQAVTAFADGEVELLARMEHARWNAERRLAGWTPGPRDPERRTTPYLVPYDELPDEIQDYDRQAVRQIPALLELVGQRVCRRGDGR